MSPPLGDSPARCQLARTFHPAVQAQWADVVWRGRGGSRDHRPRTHLHDRCGTWFRRGGDRPCDLFFAAQQWGLHGTATTIIGALLLAGGVVGLADADFAGLA